MVETKTSGKHGFGLLKSFQFKSVDGGFDGVYAIRYRDNKVDNVVTSSEMRNIELLKIAVGQFCMLRTVQNTKDVLNLDGPVFEGQILNRYGSNVVRTAPSTNSTSAANLTEVGNC